MIEWEDSKIVSDKKYLSAVKTVCQTENKYDQNAISYLLQSLQVLEILSEGLNDILFIYKYRLDHNITNQPHDFWYKFLAPKYNT
jgi:hypothetical protein